MTVNQHNLAHIIVITAEAWGAYRALVLGAAHCHIVDVADVRSGHARTACTLASRMVRLRPVTVTVFTACAMYDNIVSEIARNFEDGEDVIRSRVRHVSAILSAASLIVTSRVITELLASRAKYQFLSTKHLASSSPVSSAWYLAVNRSLALSKRSNIRDGNLHAL